MDGFKGDFFSETKTKKRETKTVSKYIHPCIADLFINNNKIKPYS